MGLKTCKVLGFLYCFIVPRLRISRFFSALTPFLFNKLSVLVVVGGLSLAVGSRGCSLAVGLAVAFLVAEHGL